MTRNLLLVIFALLTLSVFADLPDTYTKGDDVTLIANILNAGFSPDQKWLVVLQKNLDDKFFVYDGIRLNNPQ